MSNVLHSNANWATYLPSEPFTHYVTNKKMPGPWDMPSVQLKHAIDKRN